MQGILHEEPSLWTFLFVTVMLGGWAAWMSGNAAARTWRSPLSVALAMLLLAAAVRFIHFSVFGGTLLSLHYYLVDALVLIVIALLSHRLQMARQMASRYWWEIERTGPFSWRKRTAPLQTRPSSLNS